jgi:hypothetical protein
LDALPPRCIGATATGFIAVGGAVAIIIFIFVQDLGANPNITFGSVQSTLIRQAGRSGN